MPHAVRVINNRDDFNEVVECLRKNDSELTWLKLWPFRASGDHVTQLLEALMRNTNLTVLDIVTTTIDDAATDAIVSFVTQHPNSPLDTINLCTANEYYISNRNATRITSALDHKNFHSYVARLENNDPNLETLSLPGKNLTSGNIKELLSALKDNTNLKALDLRRNNIRDDTACAIAEFLPTSLLSLDLSSNNIGSNGAVAIITASLRKTTLQENTRLFELHLNVNCIKDDGVAAIAKVLNQHHNSSIVLSLRDNDYSNDAARLLVDVVGHQVDLGGEVVDDSSDYSDDEF